MKNQNDSAQRGHLLILRGPSGAGKSSVGQMLKQLRPNLEMIEIDDLKRAARGRASICIPSIDFPKAGSLARGFLDQGADVVVIEQLIDRWHLRSVLTATGCHSRSPGVSFVWLGCSLEAAIRRKDGRLTPDAVRHQHQAVAQRDRPRGELVIDTEERPVTEITRLILQALPKGFGLPRTQAGVVCDDEVPAVVLQRTAHWPL